MKWQDIPGWFQWRTGQEEAARQFDAGSLFIEVGTYLGRSLCSLAEVVVASGKDIRIVGVDYCRGSGPEGPRQHDYHGDAVARGGGTFAGELHGNIMACGHGDRIGLLVADSRYAARLFSDRSVDWVHLDGRHDYESVSADIRAWQPKMRAGGWLSGDDYDEERWPGVVRAVRELLPQATPWSSGQWRWRAPG
jgi:hypothetical protein